MSAKEYPLIGVEERIKAIRSWFAEYAIVFSELASCVRSDTTVLLEYYIAPARIVGLSADMVMRSPEAITGYGGVGAEVENLRRSGLVEALVANLSIQLINLRAAILEVRWQQTFLTGDTSAIQQVYIVVHGPGGWRIVTIIEQAW